MKEIPLLEDYNGFGFNKTEPPKMLPPFFSDNFVLLRKISGPWFIDQNKRAFGIMVPSATASKEDRGYSYDSEFALALNSCYILDVKDWAWEITRPQAPHFKLYDYEILKDLGIRE